MTGGVNARTLATPKEEGELPLDALRAISISTTSNKQMFASLATWYGLKGGVSG